MLTKEFISKNVPSNWKLWSSEDEKLYQVDPDFKLIAGFDVEEDIVTFHSCEDDDFFDSFISFVKDIKNEIKKNNSMHIEPVVCKKIKSKSKEYLVYIQRNNNNNYVLQLFTVLDGEIFCASCKINEVEYFSSMNELALANKNVYYILKLLEV